MGSRGATPGPIFALSLSASFLPAGHRAMLKNKPFVGVAIEGVDFGAIWPERSLRIAALASSSRVGRGA